MFLLRSAFWLTIAFLVIAPQSVDVREAASRLSSDAMKAGQQMIVDQVLSPDCPVMPCQAGKAALAAVTEFPSIGPPMQDSPINKPVPLPRRRPDWAG